MTSTGELLVRVKNCISIDLKKLIGKERGVSFPWNSTCLQEKHPNIEKNCGRPAVITNLPRKKFTVLLTSGQKVVSIICTQEMVIHQGNYLVEPGFS